jgi:hypothetical protein
MTSKRRPFCGSPDHGMGRRDFLHTGVAAGLGVGLGALSPVARLLAGELPRRGKRVLLLWLAGGSSQFETWDPKPGRPTGGPFNAIASKAPGVHVSELLPATASHLDKIALIRSLDTKIGDHGGAADLMQRGRRNEAGLAYPCLGTVMAKELGQADAQVPEYVSIYTATEGQQWGRPDTGFLGGRYAAMSLERSLRPENIDRPAGLSEEEYAEREHLRKFLSDRFDQGRKASEVEGYNNVFGRVRGLMRSDALFDLDREPAAVRDRYGRTDFGQHALIARRLLEAGVPVVKVARAWWDSHTDNFESHRELVGEFDRVFSTLLADLTDRGLLDSTLVLVFSEFGRTPAINKDLGRDHFASAWSVALAGCGVKGGSVFGKTDADGKAVTDGKAGAGDLAATVYQALGINPKKNYHVGARPVPLVPEDSHPIASVLA